MKEKYMAIVEQARTQRIQNFYDFCKLAKKQETEGISLNLYTLSKFFLYYTSTCTERTPELVKEHERIVRLNKKIDKVHGNS